MSTEFVRDPVLIFYTAYKIQACTSKTFCRTCTWHTGHSVTTWPGARGQLEPVHVVQAASFAPCTRTHFCARADKPVKYTMRGRCTAAAELDAGCTRGAIAELCTTFFSCTMRGLCTAAQLGTGWRCAIRDDTAALGAGCSCAIRGPVAGLAPVESGTAAEPGFGCTASVLCTAPPAARTRPPGELACVFANPIIIAPDAPLPPAGGAARTAAPLSLRRLRTRTRCPSGIWAPALPRCCSSCGATWALHAGAALPSVVGIPLLL